MMSRILTTAVVALAASVATAVAPAQALEAGQQPAFGSGTISGYEFVGCGLVFEATASPVTLGPSPVPYQCQKMKMNYKGDLTQCVGSNLALYNRVRDLPDLEQAPRYIVKMVAKGCAMLIFNVSEQKAEAAMNDAIVGKP
jgi:hypothetical protein